MSLKSDAKRIGSRVVVIAIAAGFGAAIPGAPAHAADSGRLLETGSSLLYPLFNIWIPDYTKAHPGTQITSQSTGSGTGMSQAISGLAQIGASDAYVSNALMKQHPDILNIPLAISSQMVNYNLPGMNDDHLKLSGPVLAGIYTGKVTEWNDPAIAKLNPGVKLPDDKIVPVHRTDGSGDTFIFTQYLSDSDPQWGSTLSYGTSISWPSVSGGIGAEGNQGMVNAVRQTPYSIAYIGIGFKDAITSNKLGEAMLENRSGNFVMPDDSTVQAAAAGQVAKTPPDERMSLIFASGAQAYPIINYEYVVVNEKQPSAQTAKELSQFLGWAVKADGGNAPKYLNQVGFVALPAGVRALSEKQIAKISG